MTGFFTELDKNAFFSDIYFFAEVLLIMYMFLSYKRVKPEVKTRQLIFIGFISSLVIALFYTLYFFLRITKLDPLFFDNYMHEVTALTKDKMPHVYPLPEGYYGIMKAGFLIVIYLSSVISSMIYTLVAVLFIRMNERIYKK